MCLALPESGSRPMSKKHCLVLRHNMAHIRQPSTDFGLGLQVHLYVPMLTSICLHSPISTQVTYSHLFWPNFTLPNVVKLFPPSGSDLARDGVEVDVEEARARAQAGHCAHRPDDGIHEPRTHRCAHL